MSKSGDENYRQEWITARDVIGKLDDNIRDIRKLGFTFVTALFAINSLLVTVQIPGITNSGSGSTSAFEPEVKLAILATTLVLILGLRLLEKDYSLLQAASAMRARLLERRLNLELTETIAYVAFGVGKAWALGGLVIYWVYESGIIILGVVVLPFTLLPTLVVIVGIIEALALLARGYIFRLGKDFLDWTLESLELGQNATFRIVFYNVSGDRYKFATNAIGWEILNMDGNSLPSNPGDSNHDELIVGPYNGYAWSYPLANTVTAGVYQLFVRWDMTILKPPRFQRLLRRKEPREIPQSDHRFLRKKLVITS